MAKGMTAKEKREHAARVEEAEQVLGEVEMVLRLTTEHVDA